MVPALQNYKSLDPHDIPLVWDFPVPKIAKTVEDASLEEIRAKRLEVTAPQNLMDPMHELDHFYAALLTWRIGAGGALWRFADHGGSDHRRCAGHAAEAIRRRGHGIRADRAAVGLVQPSRRGHGRVGLEDRCGRGARN